MLTRRTLMKYMGAAATTLIPGVIKAEPNPFSVSEEGVYCKHLGWHGTIKCSVPFELKRIFKRIKPGGDSWTHNAFEMIFENSKESMICTDEWLRCQSLKRWFYNTNYYCPFSTIPNDGIQIDFFARPDSFDVSTKGYNDRISRYPTQREEDDVTFTQTWKEHNAVQKMGYELKDLNSLCEFRRFWKRA